VSGHVRTILHPLRRFKPSLATVDTAFTRASCHQRTREFADQQRATTVGCWPAGEELLTLFGVDSSGPRHLSVDRRHRVRDSD
jgi:hypothetical protein